MGAHRHPHRPADAPRGAQGQARAGAGEGPGGHGFGGHAGVQGPPGEMAGGRPGEDHYRRPGPIRCDGEAEEDRPLTLQLNAIVSQRPEPRS
ncbi:MAG: hypothetical protein MZV70_68535 [Desulfobacterales bacterium]|nr:hypothetical protein [Desulfobacterales bacterium]